MLPEAEDGALGTGGAGTVGAATNSLLVFSEHLDATQASKKSLAMQSCGRAAQWIAESNIVVEGEGDDDDDERCSEMQAQATGDNGSLARHGSTITTGSCSTDAVGEKKTTKKKKKKVLGICLAHCKYDSVRRCSRWFGMKEMAESDDWALFWMDWSPTMDRVGLMKQYQKINHFPGMHEICRKDSLARNMNRLCKQFPKDYLIFPRSWCMPQDYGDFLAFCRTKKNKTFIKKPDAGCQGRGISVTRNPKDITGKEDCVVQQYISKPFLIDGFKFDYRIYVLITSCDPLRIFVHKDGLARFCTVKYTDPSYHNVDEVRMHLTNYAINKNSSDFVRDDDCGSKRRITTVDKWFVDNGYDLKRIWSDMEDVIIKTLIAAQPTIKHNYRSCFPNQSMRNSACFEILGFDLMLDKKLKPWVIEVNLSPSFHTDAPLDKEVKEQLLSDALRLINLHGVDKKKILDEEKKRSKDRLLTRGKPKESQGAENREEEEALLRAYEDANLGGYRRIFPEGNEKRYEAFFESGGARFGETAAFRARQECARAQREEIDAKQQQKELWKSRLQHGKKRAQDAMGMPAGGSHGSQGATGGVQPESPQPARRSSTAFGGHRPHTQAGQRLGTASAGNRRTVETKSVTMITRSLQTELPDSHVAIDILECDARERDESMTGREDTVRRLDIRDRVTELLEMVRLQRFPVGPDSMATNHHHHYDMSGGGGGAGVVRRKTVGANGTAAHATTATTTTSASQPQARVLAASARGQTSKRSPVKAPPHHLGNSRLFSQPDRISKLQDQQRGHHPGNAASAPSAGPASSNAYSLASQLQGIPPTQRLLSDYPAALPNRIIGTTASSGPAHPYSSGAANNAGPASRQLSSEVQAIFDGDGRAWPQAVAHDTSAHPSASSSSSSSKHSTTGATATTNHSHHHAQVVDYGFGDQRHHTVLQQQGGGGLPVGVGLPRAGFIQSTGVKPQSSIPACQLLRGRTVATTFLAGGLTVNGLGISQASPGPANAHYSHFSNSTLFQQQQQQRSSSSLGFSSAASSPSKHSHQPALEAGSRHMV